MTSCRQPLAGRYYGLALLLVTLLLMLSACSDSGNTAGIAAQHWGDAEIDVETRPLQVRPGMVEFLIIATSARGLPVHDMVVSVRMDAAAPWSQTIQDGHSGVYRRAIRVAAGQDSVYVQLRRGQETEVLKYSLRPVLAVSGSS